MNKGFIVGRICNDLEKRVTSNGKYVVEVCIAVNNSKDNTTFLRVNIFGTMADTTHRYCKKGDLVGIEYSVYNNNYEDKNGVKRYEYRFVGNTIKFLANAPKQMQNVFSMIEENKESKKDDEDIYPF